MKCKIILHKRENMNHGMYTNIRDNSPKKGKPIIFPFASLHLLNEYLCKEKKNENKKKL